MISWRLVASGSGVRILSSDIFFERFGLLPHFKLLVRNLVERPQSVAGSVDGILNDIPLFSDQSFKLFDLGFKLLDRFLFVGNFFGVLGLDLLFL